MGNYIKKEPKTDPKIPSKNCLPQADYDKIKIENNKKVAESFLKRGETLLLQGDMSGLQLFDIAEKLDPHNDELLCQMGLSLFEMANEENNCKLLKQANKYFKKSAKINAENFELWQIWGNTLHQLGIIETNSLHYFVEAKRKYLKAFEYSKHEEPDVLAYLYWDHASNWVKIAMNSGEACDLQQALQSYDSASLNMKNLPSEFWIEFGHCFFELGRRINDLRLFIKSFNCYKNAISISISSFDGWSALARALKELYEHTHDEDHFISANECFTTAAQLKPSCAITYTSWADLLITSGKQLKDPKRLKSAVEKCQKISTVYPNDEYIIAKWAEACAALGIIQDRVSLIHEAQNKISKIIDKAADKTFIWHAFGSVLEAYAKYYDDLDYTYQAIEKFQAGLSIDRTDHRLWHRLAQCYTAAAEMESEPEVFARATKFYKLAIFHQNYSFYHFTFARHLSKYAEIVNDEEILKQALFHFEQAINDQKNAIYHHPDWLFEYAKALDQMGDHTDEEYYYTKSTEIFLHVLTIDPEFPDIHYRIALAFSHLGELTSDIHAFDKAFHHFKIAHCRDQEKDVVILDWGLSILNFAAVYSNPHDMDEIYKEAEHKMITAAKLGNIHAYYHLACLYSLTKNIKRAASFLEKAKAYEALPSIDDLMQDEWLENLRNTEYFKNFIAHFENH